VASRARSARGHETERDVHIPWRRSVPPPNRGKAGAFVIERQNPSQLTRSDLWNMPVFWTIQAQRHLRHALAEALGCESDGVAIATGRCTGVLEVTLDHLNELL